MSTTTNVANGSDIYASLGLAAQTTSTTKKNDALDQADFLRLMTTQLQHQDPLNPMDNSEMVAQMAQLSTVQGITDLNTTVSSFQQQMSSDQILRGAALVGHEVLVPSAKWTLEAEGGATGTVAAPSAGDITVNVTDATGKAVKQLKVSANAAGEVSFDWDGTDETGKRLAAGSYSIAASHVDAAGNQKTLSTYVQAPVESVTVGSDGLYLNLKGLGTAPIDYVLRIS